MRRKDKEITDRAVIEAVIARARFCRLGLYDGQWPYVVPVNIGYRDGAIYFHSSRKGKKMDILGREPRVCFQLDEDVDIVGGEKPCDFTTRYTSVMGFGRAAFVEDEAERRLAFDAIMRQAGGPTEGYRPEVMKKTAILRIDIETLTGKVSPAPGTVNDVTD